jgi:outer membrane protein assembly factor BamB
MPGPSAGTPVIYDDSVFVASTDSGTKTLVAFCLDRKTGKVLWRNEVGTGLGHDNRSTYSSSSPVTDGKRVIFFYGNGDTAAFDMSGRKLWSRNIQADHGQFAFQWTFGASPTIYRGKLYMEVLQRDVPVNGRGRRDGPNESYLLAIDLDTGKDIWKHIRPSDAVAESLEAYSTPIPFENNGRSELLITGGDCITGHDPETGKELWRWGTWNPRKIGHWRLVPSPIVGDGIILACAPKADPIYAVKAGGSGVLNDSWIAWKSEGKREISSDVATPVFYDGDFFILNGERKVLSRVEPKTGDVKWSTQIQSRPVFQSSPTAADGRIYAMNFAGEVTVIEAAKGEIVQTIAMGDDGDDLTRSSIPISHGQLFIRTNQKLYCIGKN